MAIRVDHVVIILSSEQKKCYLGLFNQPQVARWFCVITPFSKRLRYYRLGKLAKSHYTNNYMNFLHWS